ncbi:hypothetical protein BWI17_06590 [Betaproteobacteria bacterium GR16-43]|nr:hypothetical protein BWI17_06590 [Betaproteobacteria bacterium GR16-43]
MKSLSDILNKTPWWALLVTGFACLVALAAFITPYHIIDYRNDGTTPAERNAIKREIDNAFGEKAIDVARGVILGMRRNTHDEARRAELDEALRGLDEARQELRDVGAEAQRAKREALQHSREAVAAAKAEIESALHQGNANPETRKALEDALKNAKEAEAQFQREFNETRSRKKRLRIGMNDERDKPFIDIDVGDADPNEKPGISVETTPTPDAPKAPPAAKGAPKPPMPAGPKSPTAIPPVPPVAMNSLAPPPAPPAVDPLPRERRDQIRQNVTGDMYRIGIGAALALILLPMFVLAVIAKFFIDRSRAATRMADLKRKEAEHHRMSQQLTEAKLQALQAQVEPHFLYNTLASVQALTEVDPVQAHAMTGHLIQYLRNALPKMREGVSTVGQEIELVRAYLSILQMRMGKRLSFEIDVPPELNGIAFPPLMLPSLVENAIKHGLEPQREGGMVRITAQQADGRLSLVVADTGRGFAETIGAGVGLANIRERLAALYGDAAKLTLVENTPRGVVATIEVPTGGARAEAQAKAAAASSSSTMPPPESSAVPPPIPPSTSASEAPAVPAAPPTRTRRILSALAAIERGWRRTLIYVFYALVIVAAVVCLGGIVGVVTHLLPVEWGNEILVGPGGALLGTAIMLLAFAILVIAAAIVVTVIYGLGFLFVGLAVFIPMVLLVGLSPILAPLVLVGLLIWWLARKKDKPLPQPARVEPT